MENATSRIVADTVSFRLGTLGARVSARFAEKIDRYGVKPKHVGMLTAIDAGIGGSQLELARALRVAPSVVVANVDELELLGALRRVRDRNDRRRWNLFLTPHGRALLEDCAAASRELDAEITADLDESQRVALGKLLGVVSTTEALPW